MFARTCSPVNRSSCPGCWSRLIAAVCKLFFSAASSAIISFIVGAGSGAAGAESWAAGAGAGVSGCAGASWGVGGVDVSMYSVDGVDGVDTSVDGVDGVDGVDTSVDGVDDSLFNREICSALYPALARATMSWAERLMWLPPYQYILSRWLYNPPRRASRSYTSLWMEKRPGGGSSPLRGLSSAPGNPLTVLSVH